MAKIRIKNKTDVDLHGLKAGGERDIDADEFGTPLDKHFRRRLRDESIEIIKDEPKPKKKAIKSKEDE